MEYTRPQLCDRGWGGLALESHSAFTLCCTVSGVVLGVVSPLRAAVSSPVFAWLAHSLGMHPDQHWLQQTVIPAAKQLPSKCCYTVMPTLGNCLHLASLFV